MHPAQKQCISNLKAIRNSHPFLSLLEARGQTAVVGETVVEWEKKRTVEVVHLVTTASTKGLEIPPVFSVTKLQHPSFSTYVERQTFCRESIAVLTHNGAMLHHEFFSCGRSLRMRRQYAKGMETVQRGFRLWKRDHALIDPSFAWYVRSMINQWYGFRHMTHATFPEWIRFLETCNG